MSREKERNIEERLDRLAEMIRSLPASRQSALSDLLAQQWYSPAQVAQFTGLHVETIRRLCRNGSIPSARIGGRVRIARKSLEQLLGESKTHEHRNRSEDLP